MKRAIGYILAIACVFALCCSATAVNQNTLSELSDEECIAFLESNGIEIPEVYNAEMSWIPFIRAVIKQVEDNPEVEFAFGYSVAANLAYEIKAAAKAYYGMDNKNAYSLQRSSSILQDNELYGSWKTEYENYNCYAYAIGYTEAVDPGMIRWINNGNSKDDYIYNWTANESTVAEWIEFDLESLGYTVTARTSTNPNTVVTDHVNMICVRTDLDGDLYYGIRDYHFMKKGMDGNWYHKPGRTNPLKYLYVPLTAREWVNEGYNGATAEYFRYTWYTYDSEIYFIEYTTPHEWEYRYCGTSNGSNQHIQTCMVCGGTTGTALNCIYPTGSDNCRICGHNKNLIDTASIIPESPSGHTDN